MLKDVWVVCVSCKNNTKWHIEVLLTKTHKICLRNCTHFPCTIFICYHLILLQETELSPTYILQMSVKFANDVFFVPILTTWGGFITNFFFSPVTISGFLARIISNTLVNNCIYYNYKKKESTSKVHM